MSQRSTTALKTKQLGTAVEHKAKDSLRIIMNIQKILACQEIFYLQGVIMLNSHGENSTLLDIFLSMYKLSFHVL